MGVTAEFMESRLILPSLLSADFARLGEEVAAVTDAGARIVHFDVMDGHFVPNITIGPVVVGALASQVHSAGGLLDVHLMIEEPDRYLGDFVEAGADALSVHVETCPNLHRTLQAIRELGASPGVVVNPATDPSSLGEAIKFVDYVLVMTVNPGFGGQRFIREMVDKIKRVREMLPEGKALEVDGGIGSATIEEVMKAGANWFVAGSAVFGGGDPGGEVQRLQRLVS